MKAFPIRTVTVALALIAAVIFTPIRSNAQVKSTAAAVGFKAAKIAVVFNDVVKLSESIQKVSYRPDEDPSGMVKQYLASQFEAEGVDVTDESGEQVADLTFYIGLDDADDDNDGQADAADELDFTNEAPAGTKDTDIAHVDLDQKDAKVAAMPDTVPNQGIYILVVNHATGESEVFTMTADVLGEFTRAESNPSAINLVPRNTRSRGEANHAVLGTAFQPTVGASQWLSYAVKSLVQTYAAPLKAYLKK